MDTVECRHCSGKGCRPLPDHLQRTLDDIRKWPGCQIEYLQILAIGRSERIGQTAMCNRVKDLEDLGFVEGRREAHSTGGIYRRFYAKETAST